MALHGDHLFAHVEGDFGAFKIYAHFFDKQAGDADPIDLVDGVKFLTAPDDRVDHLLVLQSRDEFYVDAADFCHFGNA